MKVKELIEKLENEDPEALVVFYNSSHHVYNEVTNAFPIPVRRPEPRGGCSHCDALASRNLRQASNKDKEALKAVKLTNY